MTKTATKEEPHIIRNADIKGYAERLDALLDQAEGIRLDIKEVKTEAKANGISPKALADAVKIKRKGRDTDHEMLVTTYLEAIGGAV